MNRKRAVSLLIIIVSIVMIFLRITVVQIHDTEFERFVREHSGGNSISMTNERETIRDGFLKKKDLIKVKDIYVDLNEYQIKDLRDLKNFVNLKSLLLAYKLKVGEAAYSVTFTNIGTLNSLKNLETLELFGIVIDDKFNQISIDISKLILWKCRIDNSDFIRNFTEVKHLTIRDCRINSLEFIESLNKLSVLQLDDCDYECSLEPLALAENLTDLSVFSDNPWVFEQLPIIPSVKELYLAGEAIPSREQAERYFKWDNLEALWLGGDKYDVATGIWITQKDE